jgi:N utilization substance protein B
MSGDAAAPPRRPTGSRRLARLGAVQALYQIELSASNPELTIAEFIQYRLGQEIEGDQYAEADADWFADIVRGVCAKKAELDPAIEEFLSKERQVARLEAILRAILRGGAYEIVLRPDVPAKVAITEYVAVASAFFSGTEPTLVNAVLDKLAHRYRAAELSRPAAGGHGGGR